MSPQRIQRKRTKGWKMPDNTVYVGRPGKFGNPFAAKVKQGTVNAQHGEAGLATMARQNLVDDFRYWLTRPDPAETCRLANGAQHKHLGVAYDDRQSILDGFESLRGKNLACWCPEGQPCHADVLLELANRTTELNTGYFLDGVKYCQAEERKRDMPSLFDLDDDTTAA